MSGADDWLPDEPDDVPAREERVWTPTLVNSHVKALLRDIDRLTIRGEVCDYRGPASSGHLYFGLRDARCRLSAVMWRSSAQRLGFRLENGQEVLAVGRVDLYAEGGRYQLMVDRMEPDGLGARMLALEQLKRSLAALGLFDAERKQEIPWLPRVVGVVTSEKAAALQDVLRTVDRRFAGVHVLISPCKVQGAEAPDSIRRAVHRLERDGRADVILLVRGGGSMEDLAAFNTEEVVRAVADCTIPIICGVGHEVDTSLADLAADKRAATPTAAAEAAVPDGEELELVVQEALRRLRLMLRGSLDERVRHLGRTVHRMELQRGAGRRQAERLDNLRRRLTGALRSDLLGRSRRLTEARSELAAQHPGRELARRRHAFEQAARALGWALTGAQRDRRHALAERVRPLHALSPLQVLGRGYAIAFDDDGRAVRDAAELREDQALRLQFAKGSARARVEEID